jgi:hypothetical protein
LIATVPAVPGDRASREPFAVRILLALGAQAVFASLTDVLAGAAPAFEVTVVFGLVVALGMEFQARSARVS